MNEIKRAETFERLIPDILSDLNLYEYEKIAIKHAAIALREKAERENPQPLTLDAAPVVRCGEWIFDHTTGETAHWTHCSVCEQKRFYASEETYFDYCPNCGAKMDKRRESETSK